MLDFKKFCLIAFGCGLCTPNTPEMKEVPVVLLLNSEIETGKMVKVAETFEVGMEKCGDNIFYRDVVEEAERKLKSVECDGYFNPRCVEVRTHFHRFRDKHGFETTTIEQIRDFAIAVTKRYDHNIELRDMILFSQTINDKLSCKVVLGVGGIPHAAPLSGELSEFIEAKLGLLPGEYKLYFASGNHFDLTEAIRLTEQAEQLTENNYHKIAIAACKIFKAQWMDDRRRRITEFVGMMERFAPNTRACEHVGFDSLIKALTDELEGGEDYSRRDMIRAIVVYMA